jgi:hypothetical protein
MFARSVPSGSNLDHTVYNQDFSFDNAGQEWNLGLHGDSETNVNDAYDPGDESESRMDETIADALATYGHDVFQKHSHPASMSIAA